MSTPTPIRRAALPTLSAAAAAGATLLAVSSSTAPVPGDASGDGVVSFADITAVLANWPQGSQPAPVGTAAEQLVRELSAGLVVVFNFDNDDSKLVYMAVEAPSAWGGAEGLADRLGRRDAFKGPTSDGRFPAWGEEAAR